jgi:hypothetical protein
LAPVEVERGPVFVQAAVPRPPFAPVEVAAGRALQLAVPEACLTPDEIACARALTVAAGYVVIEKLSNSASGGSEAAPIAAAPIWIRVRSVNAPVRRALACTVQALPSTLVSR